MSPENTPIGQKALSPRLSEILGLAAQGLTDKEIAQELGLSVETVLSHWKRLRAHFETSSRTEIVARVLEGSSGSKLERLAEEQRRLLFEIAERDRLQAQLEVLNQRLEEEVQRRGEVMMRALAEYERKQSAVMLRNDYLEKFHAIMRRFVIVPHIGDYGASFRKHWVGETLQEHGYRPEDWCDGSISVFDCANHEDLTFAMKMFESLDPSTKRVIVPHRFRRADGTVRMIVDFIELDPLNANGVGLCHVCSFDITDWIPMLKERIGQGWPDLPLHD